MILVHTSETDTNPADVRDWTPIQFARAFAYLYGSGDYGPDDTSSRLRLYSFPQEFDPIAFAARYGYRVKTFSFEPERFRVPNLKTDGYANGTVWIYDPEADHGSFRDHDIGRDASVRYTFAWRVTHEVAHALTECRMERLYGPSRRNGRLGLPMVQSIGRPAPGRVLPTRTLRPLTYVEALRAVHWELDTFATQRRLLADVGITVSDLAYTAEVNVNLTDAIARVCSGDFTDPGAAGFIPAVDRHPNMADVREFLRFVLIAVAGV